MSKIHLYFRVLHNIIPRGQKPLKKHPNATDNSTEFLKMSKALQKAAKNLFFK